MRKSMNQKENLKGVIIQAAVDGSITVESAAKRLNLSERRVKQLKKEYREKGVLTIHGNCGRKPAHSLTDTEIDTIVLLKKSYEYEKANYSHFQELIEEHNGIKIAYTPLRNLLIANGIPSPRKHRKTKSHHRRKRKESMGMMLQADGTPHDWFENGSKQSLHGFIDDATGVITGLYMCENECLHGYLEVTKQTLLNHGIPMSLYPDKASVFFPKESARFDVSIEDQLNGVTENFSQFGLIMNTLGISMFPAHSPQAKGRIERLWETLQDRLVTEFRIHKITTIEAANKFLVSYIKKYNKKFAVEPQNPSSAFIPMLSSIDLDRLLCYKLSRKTDPSGVFSINNEKFQVLSKDIPPRAKVEVLISPKFGIQVIYKEIMSKTIPLTSLNNGVDASGKSTKAIIASIVQEYFLRNAKAS